MIVAVIATATVAVSGNVVGHGDGHGRGRVHGDSLHFSSWLQFILLG